MKIKEDKYLGKKFGRWTVSRFTVIQTAKSKHKRYYLTRKTHDGAIKTVALRGNELAFLRRGEKTMPQLLKGKQFQRDRFPSREFRNSVWYTFNTNGSLE